MDLSALLELFPPRLATRNGVKNVADYSGTDTARFVAAMAGGGTIEIPAGTYTLKDCEIPNDVDVTLKPLGNVIVQWDGTGGHAALYARYVEEGTNVSTETAITSITHAATSWPSANKQANTILGGAASAFADYEAGDVVFIQSDLLDEAGCVEAEWAEVAAVQSSDTELVLTRPTNWTYAGATTFTVRRLLSRPKLRILPGITFRPSTDVSAAAARTDAIYLAAPIEPEIDVAIDGAYAIGVYMDSPYRGEVKVRARGFLVDYSKAAYGYGVSLFGAAYRTKLWLDAKDTGHVCTLNGDPNISTYNGAEFYRRGVPVEVEIMSLISDGAHRSAWDSHWSYRTRTHYLSVSGTTMTALESNNNTNAIGGAAVDPWFGMVVCRDIYRPVYVADSYGKASTWTIEHLAYDNPYAVAQRPIVGYEGSADAVQPKVVINGGYSRMATSYHLDFNQSGGASNRSPDVSLSNFVFYGGYAIGRVRHDNYGTWRLANCRWEADGVNTLKAGFRVEVQATNSAVIVDGLRIVQDANDNPDGVFLVVTVNTNTVGAYVTNVVAELDGSTAVALYSSDNVSGGVITAIATSTVDSIFTHSDGTTGGTGSAGAGNEYVELVINGTTYKVLHDGTV